MIIPDEKIVHELVGMTSVDFEILHTEPEENSRPPPLEEMEPVEPTLESPDAFVQEILSIISKSIEQGTLKVESR